MSCKRLKFNDRISIIESIPTQSIPGRRATKSPTRALLNRFVVLSGQHITRRQTDSANTVLSKAKNSNVRWTLFLGLERHQPSINTFDTITSRAALQQRHRVRSWVFAHVCGRKVCFHLGTSPESVDITLCFQSDAKHVPLYVRVSHFL